MPLVKASACLLCRHIEYASVDCLQFLRHVEHLWRVKTKSVSQLTQNHALHITSHTPTHTHCTPHKNPKYHQCEIWRKKEEKHLKNMKHLTYLVLKANGRCLPSQLESKFNDRKEKYENKMESMVKYDSFVRFEHVFSLKIRAF